MSWTIARLQSLITDQVEESLTLDYKAAASLARSDSRKAEITKDVSSFANSAGGTIIYGMKEHDEPDKRHLAAAIDPVDRMQFSKEWLEHVIGNIRPRIENAVIHPVTAWQDPTGVVYVVEVPQSMTAHQALDFRYYKRFNFESVPMFDYEIRDILARGQHPIVTLQFEIVAESHVDTIGPGISIPLLGPPSYHDTINLYLRASNSGNKYAQYVNAILLIPKIILSDRNFSSRTKVIQQDGVDYVECFVDNTRRDVVDMKMGSPTYGPSRHEPILPKLTRALDDFILTKRFDKIDTSNLAIEWTVYADNAPPLSGRVAIRDISFVDKRRKAGGTEQ